MRDRRAALESAINTGNPFTQARKAQLSPDQRPVADCGTIRYAIGSKSTNPPTAADGAAVPATRTAAHTKEEAQLSQAGSHQGAVRGCARIKNPSRNSARPNCWPGNCPSNHYAAYTDVII